MDCTLELRSLVLFTSVLLISPMQLWNGGQFLMLFVCFVSLLLVLEKLQISLTEIPASL